MVKLNATLEITPIKFDTDSWKNFSTGYKITCVNYTQEEIMHFKQDCSITKKFIEAQIQEEYEDEYGF